MSKTKIADYDNRLAAMQTQLASANAKAKQTQNVGEKIAALSKKKAKIDEIKKLGVELDLNTATLDDVRNQEQTLNGSIAELIVDLDEVTSSFGDTFKSMKAKTTTEKLVGWFSSTKSDSMRETRIRSTNIQENLNDLIDKSNKIVSLLQGQKSILEEEKVKTSVNLSEIMQQRIEVVSELENVRKEMQTLLPTIDALKEKAVLETDPKTRTEMDAEIQKQSERYNELVNEEQVKVALSQTIERYIEQFKTTVDSIENQISTQRVLIEKLQTDTRQRSILYDALVKSLSTANQQNIAHQINNIGTKVDAEAQASMAAIGAAAQNNLVAMLEAHPALMREAMDVARRKQASDDQFWARFGKVLEDHDKGRYDGQNAA